MKLLAVQKRMLIFLTVVVILLLVLFYVQWILPLSQELNQMNREINAEQQIINVLKGKQSDREDRSETTNVLIEKKLPDYPSLHIVLLDFKKAENISNSKVTSIKVDDGSVSKSNKNDEDSIATLNVNNKQDTLPNGAKPILLDLTVVSPNYSQFKSFITSIENQPRIYSIEKFSLPGRPEGGLETDPLVYSVQIKTYYSLEGKTFEKNLNLPEQVKQDPFYP